MAKTSAYWKKRFETLEAASNKYGQECFMKIEPAFDEAYRQIEKEINSWYGRFAKNNQITMQEAKRLLNSKELKEFKWDVYEYIKYGKQNDLNQLWMKELENASAKYHVSRLEALKLRTQQAAEVAFGNELDKIDEMARKVFTEDYYHSIFEVQKGFNIGWNIGQIDERKLEKIISKPWAADGKNFSNRIWEQRSQLVNELHTQLTRTCILGKAPDDAIKAISKKFNTTKNQAGRLVMTEQAYFHSVAQKEAFEELDVEEFEIVATLDAHTSEVCQEMDGKHFPMKEYQPGSTAPPFHVWCRSVTVPFFDDEFSLGKRAARDEKGKTYYVPSDMKYKDWKKSLAEGQVENIDGIEYYVLKFEKTPEGRKAYGDYIDGALKKNNLSKEEHDELWKSDGGYIQNAKGYKDINNYMRGVQTKLNNPNCESTMDVLIDTTTKNTLHDNFVGYRKVQIGFVNDVMGLNIDVNSLTSNFGHIEKFKSKNAAEELANAIKQIIGTEKAIITDKAVTSISLSEKLNAFSNRVFGFEILLPKGTKGLLTDNFPESEFIACPNTTLEIFDVKVYNIDDRFGKRPAVKMFARIIKQGR